MGGDGVDDVHDGKSHEVVLGHAGNAALVDGAQADVGSGSGKAKAKSPAGLVQFLTTLGGTFVEFALAAFSSLALGVLVRTIVLNTLDQFRGLGEGESNQEEGNEENFHDNK